MNNDTCGSILIVDDNPTNLRALLNYLEKSGFNILVATSGERTLKQLERFQPDIILLDVLMPGIDGFETCRRLKADERTRNIPVIFMTALTETTDKIKGFEAGGVDYLTKPLQYQEVIARVTTHLTLRRLQQQLEVQNARLEQQNLRLEEQNAQLHQEIAKREQVEESLREHTHRLALLNQTSDLLQTCLTEEETYSVLVRMCKQIFPLSSGTLSFMNESKTGLVVRTSWGDPPDTPLELSQEKHWGSDPDNLKLIEHPETGSIHTYIEVFAERNALCAPISASGEIMAVLSIYFDQQLSSESQKNIGETNQMVLTGVAEHYALSLVNLRLRETLRMQSIRDPLTGLYNRRHMEALLEQEIRRTERHKTPIGFIMLDIDHFKTINDTYGHDAGDVVLKHLGQFIQHSFRSGDIICRYGGEEFLLILPETSLKTTGQRAENLRSQIETFRTSCRDTILHITISVGVAALPDHGPEARDAIKTADKALYQAKAEGRNRVVVAAHSNISGASQAK